MNSVIIWKTLQGINVSRELFIEEDCIEKSQGQYDSIIIKIA